MEQEEVCPWSAFVDSVSLKTIKSEYELFSVICVHAGLRKDSLSYRDALQKSQTEAVILQNVAKNWGAAQQQNTSHNNPYFSSEMFVTNVMLVI